jgi:hypothetical protein
MAKNHSLALHIQDAAWGETRQQLEYKTVLYGSKLTVRDRFYASSKLCSACGWKNEWLLLSDRVWRCLMVGGTYQPAVKEIQSEAAIILPSLGTGHPPPESKIRLNAVNGPAVGDSPVDTGSGIL